MTFVILILTGLLTVSLWADNVPPLNDLGNDSYEIRERAESLVTAWAKAHPVEAREKLLKLYVRGKDPEVRRRLIPALEHAYFPRKGYVGVQMMSASFDQFGKRRQGNREAGERGVVITRVAPGTPAEDAGLIAGDIILKINAWEVKADVEITAAAAREIQKNSPETPVQLQVKRGEKLMTIEIKLGILPVPSERARLMRASVVAAGGLVSSDVLAQLEEFRQWLHTEIEKDRKNLIADQRL